MTIGRNSRQSSVRGSIRAPKFLDKSSGFYGRLEELELAGEGEEVGGREVGERLDGTESGGIDGETLGKAEGMMGDDSETLLQRKPSRLSSRWRRSTRRKQEEDRVEEDQPRDEVANMLPSEFNPVVIKVAVGEEERPMAEPNETTLVHFATREDADDQVLIRDTKRGTDEEGEEEWKMKKQQEEGMKMVKRNAVKNYRKALDRAFRRGWGAFVTNLYSVTLTPVKPAMSRTTSPSVKKQQQQHNSVLAEFP